MKKLTTLSILLFGVITVSATFTSCSCEHEWTEATCTEAKTCSLCGKKEGEALGHTTVVDEAVEPTCSTEGLTEGEHCVVCKEITKKQQNIKVLSHRQEQLGEWIFDYDNAIKTREVCCTECETIVEIEEEKIDSFVEDDYFMFYPSTFEDRLEEASKKINGYSFYVKSGYNENMFWGDENNIAYCEIENMDDDWKSIGMVTFFKDEDKSIPISQYYTKGVAKGIEITIGDSDDVSAIVVTTVMAIDPSLSYSEAFDVAEKILKPNSSAGTLNGVAGLDGVTHNSINYLLYKNNGYFRGYSLIVTIE